MTSHTTRESGTMSDASNAPTTEESPPTEAGLPDGEPPVFSARDLNVFYGDFKAVKDVSMNVWMGE